MLNVAVQRPRRFWHDAMVQARRELDRALGNWPEDRPAPADCPVEVCENASSVTMSMPLHGFRRGDVFVEVDDGELIVIADRIPYRSTLPRHGQPNRPMRFEWNVTLPANIDPARIEAKFRNDVLGLTLHKVPSGPPRQISIQ